MGSEMCIRDRASNDAVVLAQAMADRLPSIYFDEPLFSSTTELVDSPSSSLWLICALMQARSRDPVSYTHLTLPTSDLV